VDEEFRQTWIKRIVCYFKAFFLSRDGQLARQLSVAARHDCETGNPSA
jgi:hypothetical protein